MNRKENHIPQTLLEAVAYFADERSAWACVVNRRWANGATCPRCASAKVHFIETRLKWRCNDCKQQFSAKTGTIFEESPIGFAKWLPAMWLIANAKNGISSCELSRALGVTQKTAWFMLHRVRLAFQNGTFEKLAGHVEADETFIGGKSRNKHADRRRETVKGTGGAGSGKEIVLGILERGGTVVTLHVNSTRRASLEPIIRSTVEDGSRIYTDSLPSYNNLNDWYKHQCVDHAVAYVDGLIHTNGLENFWSLLKRTLRGTYVSVEPFHLFRYLDEQAWRYNLRGLTDAQRFVKVLSQVIGKRLTFDELTGKMCNA